MRTLILICICFNLFGQKSRLDTVFCDCELAKEIVLTGNKRIGPTMPPMGPGLKNEISYSKNKSQYVFEREHHSAWYKLVIKTTGTLIFDIMPNQTNDDYDFVLFKTNKTGFCDSLERNKIKPIRSCISRDKEGIISRTGLSNFANNDLIKEGRGEQYANSIEVENGDLFYLVLDNVYENGDGHAIQFYFEELIPFVGVIKDEDSIGVQADITLINQKGDTVITKKTLPDGSYNFSIPLKRNLNYTINFYNDNNFSYSKNIALKDSTEIKALSTVLPKLKKGSKHSVGSINFVPGETMYLQRSIPSMMNLYKLLQRNENLKITLIGHCNGNGMMLSKKAVMQFTVDRAITIRDFLVKKGIDASRIQVDGRGPYEMLFMPVDRISEKQAEMNRRVEVKVLEY